MSEAVRRSFHSALKIYVPKKKGEKLHGSRREGAKLKSGNCLDGELLHTVYSTLSGFIYISST